jgi:LPS-assembly protein
MKLKFYQRFTQSYYLDRDYELGDMSNEMKYNWNQWSLYNITAYSHEYGKLRESSSYLSLSKREYYFRIGHTYKETLPDLPASTAANDTSISFGYTYNEQIKLNGGFTYDVDDSSNRQWRFGGSYHRDCWSVAASIRQDITPRPIGYTTDNTFYVQLNFIPFGALGTE